jgi:hypothetical protein
MASTEDIHNTQKLANAAEAFVRALDALFEGDTFDQFFHGETLRRAYWVALQKALEQVDMTGGGALARGLQDGQVLAEPRIVDELLKQFVPGQAPDYESAARVWAEAVGVPPGGRDGLPGELEAFFALLAGELRRSGELRIALRQLERSGGVRPRQAPGEDLERLLDAAVVGGQPMVARQVRHLLALVSERDPAPPAASPLAVDAQTRLVAYLEPDALRALWERVAALDDPALRLRLMGRIVPHLYRHHLIPNALAPVQSIIESAEPPLDPALRVDALCRLAPHLAAFNRDATLPSFQQRVLDDVLAIDDPASRVRALGALIARLPPAMQSEAVAMAFETAACCIPNEVARATALSVLPSHLPLEFQTRLLSIARDLAEPDARALLLGRMLAYLPASMQLRTLIEALDAIQQITGDDARARALIALAPYIDAVGPLQNLPEGMQQAIAVTFSIARQDDRARAFAALAPYLSPELLTEALQALKGITDDVHRALTLAKLAPHLPDDLSVAAFGIAQELSTPEARAAALSAIAPYLGTQARAQALADALAAALAVERRYERVVALVDLAPHLPPDLRTRALSEALTATRSIPDESERGRALVFLAPHLLPEHLADALADAYTILDPLERVPVLSALLPFLPDEPRERVAQDVIDTANQAPRPEHKASMLAAIAPVMPDKLVGVAAQAAVQIHSPYDQMHVLTALLPRQPEHLRDAALAAAHAVPDPYQRVSALLELIAHTPPELHYAILEEALETALKVTDDYDRASALAHLAPYVGARNELVDQQQVLLDLALSACLDVADPAARRPLLAQWAATCEAYLAPAQTYMLWRRLVEFLRERPYAEVIADLAALAPVVAHLGAVGAVDLIAARLLGQDADQTSR